MYCIVRYTHLGMVKHRTIRKRKNTSALFIRQQKCKTHKADSNSRQPIDYRFQPPWDIHIKNVPVFCTELNVVTYFTKYKYIFLFYFRH